MWILKFNQFRILRTSLLMVLTRYEPDSFNIVLSLRVHLLQFSTGNPHPLATSHIIHVQQMRKSLHLPSAAISGHKLFVHSPRWTPTTVMDFTEESVIQVFDWITGDCLFVSHSLLCIYTILL